MEGKKAKMSAVVELIVVLLNKIIKKCKRPAGSRRIISKRHERDNI